MRRRGLTRGVLCALPLALVGWVLLFGFWQAGVWLVTR